MLASPLLITNTVEVCYVHTNVASIAVNATYWQVIRTTTHMVLVY